MTYCSDGPRWDAYFLERGEGYGKFWEWHLQSTKRDVLIVLGKGFDSRMCKGYESILNAGGCGKRDCLLVEFDEGPDSPSRRYEDAVSKNLLTLKELSTGYGQLISKYVPMWSTNVPNKNRIGSQRAAGVFSDIADFYNYSDIVIDVSALPRGIYFSIIGKALYLLDLKKSAETQKQLPNLHIVVSENPELDQKIVEDGIDDNAHYIHGLGIELDLEATAEIPKIWLPILSEGKNNQLEKIYSLVVPEEICPILPFPSSNPRRSENILIELREPLFDQWRVEPRNIMFASEQNPFDIYRQIYQTVHHYNQVLEPLGGCKAAVSAVSSKLLSLGALLATYELKREGMGVGFAHVEAHGYNMSDIETQNNVGDEELFTLWLTGECNEP